MTRGSYRENDYGFGQTMLTLRSAIGLTQARLAEILGVSRQSVAEWEAGSKYPKFNHLQAVIALAVQHGAFSPGNEAEEIRALWKASRQKVLLDERWLTELLRPAMVDLTPAEAVAENHQPHSSRPAFNNLPFQPTPFIGRTDELSEIANLLSDPACRLLTLLGPGGIGKTRLAIEAASRQMTAYTDGVIFVGLASISDAQQLTLAIGDALNLSFVGHPNPISYLLAELRERHLLLILDNFEHLLAGITLVNDILSNAPQITVLVTSRERLRLRAEWLFEVGGLAYPIESHAEREAMQYSAVQLFIGRVRQIQPRLPLAAPALNCIVQICQYVEGMPLAIELAAASTYSIPLFEVEQRIRLNLDTLNTPFYDASPRQRSLRATFDYSWDLLDESERLLFSRLAVFRGGCTSASAEQVAGTAPALLDSLVNKSLLRQSDEAEPRYSFLEPLREYALEKLAAYGELAGRQQAHARYFLALAQAAPGQWGNTREDEITLQLDHEHDNLRAALRWACDSGETAIALQLGLSLWRFWRRGGYISEGRIWLDNLLAMAFDSSDPDLMTTRLRLIEQAAWLAADQNDYQRAGELFEGARTLRRSLGEAEDDIAFLANEAFQARAAGNYQRGVGLLEDTIARQTARQRALGNDDARLRADLGHSHYTLAMMLREQGEFGRAAALIAEGIQNFTEIGDREAVAQGWLSLSDLGRDHGDPAQVRQYCEPALPVFREFGTQWAVGFTLINLGLAAYFEGSLAEARVGIENALNLFRTVQNDGALAEGLIVLGTVSQAQGDLTAAFDAQVEAFRLAMEIGPRLIVAMALDGLATTLTRLGHLTTAVQCLAISSNLRDEMDTPVRPVDQPILDQTLHKLQSTMGSPFNDLWSSATTRPPQSVLDKVLSLTATRESPFNRAASSPTALPTTRVEWEDALVVDAFYGREWELRMLTEWGVRQQCQVITILGLGGIGKSALAIHFMHRVANEFECVIWRSLRDLPTCDVLLADLLQILVPQALSSTVNHFEGRMQLLMEHLRAKRVLIVLDNVESVLQDGEISGRMRLGYEGFGRFLTHAAGTQHRSMIMLTTRQKPDELLPHEGGGAHAPVRTLRLVALDISACERLLTERNITGTASQRSQLIQTYGGNPLALKIVAQTILDLFAGEIAPFLAQGGTIFGGVYDLLHEQFRRLSHLEQRIAYWLTIMREPITFSELQSLFMTPLPPGTALDTMNRLYRHSLIERGQAGGSFTLQSVVLEYLTEQLIAEAADEIVRGELNILIHYGLEQAHVKDYVRQTQTRLLIAPLIKRLQSMALPDFEGKIYHLLDALRDSPTEAQGYGPANLVVLLNTLHGHLNRLDLSGLALRGLHLQGVEMQDTSLAKAALRDTMFSETFDIVTALALSGDGRYWAASSRRGEIRIWEAGGITLHREWQAHTDMIWSLNIGPAGHTIASASWDGSIKVSDIATGALLWTGEHSGHANRVAFSPDGHILASAGNDATIRLWNAERGTLLQTISQPDAVTALAWSPDGTRIAAGDIRGCVRVWTVNANEPAHCILTLNEHVHCIEGMAFSLVGHSFATASWDSTVKLWDAETGRVLTTLTGHTDRAFRVAWSPDGRALATGGRDQIILIWDMEHERYRAVLRGHSSSLSGLAFTPEGQNLVSGGEDGTLRVWELSNGQCSRVIQGYASSLYDVDWSPDGTQLVCSSTDALVTVFDVDGEKPPRLLRGHTGVIYGVGWRPDGGQLASSEWDNALRLWDVRSGASRRVVIYPEESGHYFYGLKWSSDGSRIAGGTYRRGVLAWDVDSNRPSWEGVEFHTWIRHVAWSPDGRYLAGGGEDGHLYIWDASDGTLIRQLAGHQSLIRAIVWSPDGARLASGGGGHNGDEILIWDAERGKLLSSIAGHPGIVYTLAWDMGKDSLVSGGSDGVLRWWDVQTAGHVGEREAHQGTIQALRASPDGTKLASCGDDGAVMIWDLFTGDHLRTLRRDRPYERMDITGIRGLTEAQKATLRQLGAVETA